MQIRILAAGIKSSLFLMAKVIIRKGRVPCSFLSRIKNSMPFSYKIQNVSLIFPWDKFSPLLVCREHFQYVNPFTIPGGGVHTVGRKAFGVPLDAISHTLTLFQNKKQGFRLNWSWCHCRCPYDLCRNSPASSLGFSLWI